MSDEIKKAVEILKDGGIVAYPTDTLFGVGCDATNIEAVKKLIEKKKRDKKPMSIACSSLEMIEEYASIGGDERQVIRDFFPGPFTILLNKKETVLKLVTAGSEKVGVRIPDYPKIIEIISELNKPIISTSANLAGEPDIVDLNQLKLDVDFVVGGECKYKEGSTVFDIREKKILRKGVRTEEIAELINNI